MDEMIGRFEAAGYESPLARNEVRPGVVIAFVDDPEGNWIEFVEARPE